MGETSSLAHCAADARCCISLGDRGPARARLRSRQCRPGGRNPRRRRLYEPLFCAALSLAAGLESGRAATAAVLCRLLCAEHACAGRRSQGDGPRRRPGRILRRQADRRCHGDGQRPRGQPFRGRPGDPRAVGGDDRRPFLRAGRRQRKSALAHRIRHRYPMPCGDFHFHRSRTGTAGRIRRQSRPLVAASRRAWLNADGSALPGMRQRLRHGREHSAESSSRSRSDRDF